MFPFLSTRTVCGNPHQEAHIEVTDEFHVTGLWNRLMIYLNTIDALFTDSCK